MCRFEWGRTLGYASGLQSNPRVAAGSRRERARKQEARCSGGRTPQGRRPLFAPFGGSLGGDSKGLIFVQETAVVRVTVKYTSQEVYNAGIPPDVGDADLARR